MNLGAFFNLLRLAPTLAAGSGVVLLALAGCGGGADGATDLEGSAAATAPGATLLRALATTAAPGWTNCASEGQTCAFSGTREVRYGTPTTYVTRTLTGGTGCNNGVFGDPAYGIVKSCWVADDGSVAPTTTPTAAPTTATTWTGCANEGQTCSFSGTRQVRYGAGSQFAYGNFGAQVACSNAVFGDPLYGTAKTCWYADTAAAPPPPPTPTAPVASPVATGTNPPIVFNATASAAAGDMVSLQGENFGTAPSVTLDGNSAAPLAIVNQVGSGWLAVQLPASASGALILRVANATGVSAPIKLNAARPLHLDTLQLVPSGAFRLFGRNLLVPGSTPSVTIDGSAATVDLARSDEHMLSLTAPAALKTTAAAVVMADNGNGSGAARLDRPLSVVAGGGADPFGLGVGWANGFAASAGNSIDAARDPRLAQKAVCNGSRDDTAALQAAIELAAANGGGVVQVPAGRCRLASGLSLRSKVVVQGAGKGATELVYESNYPVWAMSVDLTGLRNLTLTNAGGATEGMLLKQNTRLFLQNVRVNLGTSRQMYLTGNRQFAVLNSEIVQAGSISHQGPYVFDDSTGVVFDGNTTQWVDGAPSFARVHDSYLHANRFVRDAASQALNGGTVHSLVIDFVHRTAIVGNTFEVLNGPIGNAQRNDGETILTEGGGGNRTENLGTVGAATATTLSDAGNTLNVDPFGSGAIPENYGVAIVGGKGAGQTRRVVAYARPTLTVERAWDVTPDATSRYATFVWGLEKSLILGNNLAQNPRGIWLYHTAVREVDVVDNHISEGGGIYLRAYQNLASKMFTPIYNVLIAKNQIVNTTGRWMSYVNAVFVDADARAFGIAMLGIEMRSNRVTANLPNVTSATEEYAGVEGFMTMMRVENTASYESSTTPQLLGTLMTGNLCTNCSTAVRIGTGAGGTTIVGSQLVNSAAALSDWATTSSSEKSTGTVVR